MIDSFGLTHRGNVRSNNEDSYAAVPEHHFFIVADGIGGARGGERASQLVVETLVKEVEKAGLSVTHDSLVAAVELANRTIHWEAEQNPHLGGMGTTVTMAMIQGSKVMLVNAGDSRVYRYSKNKLKQLTTDNNWINDVGSTLGLTAEQQREHPYRHMLTKAVGVEAKVNPNQLEASFSSGDILLLCSDGLHGVLSKKSILTILAASNSLEEKANALIKATLAEGAPDNVTVLLVENRPD